MSATARLSLPYIAPQQAQKQVSYNEAMALLDQLVQPTVISRSTAAPPSDPAEGDSYIVGPSPSGAWSAQAGRIACWRDGGWTFTTPADGWLAYVLDAAEIAVCQAGAWASLVTNGGASVAKFGINATADLTNRLAVGADASLFSHAGAGHRLTVNKASAADTAGLLLEDDYSGRAEIGLTGDDALHLKVSSDGAVWHEALTVAPDTGLVSLPLGQLAFPAPQNPSADPRTLDDYEEGTFTPVLAFGGVSTGIAYGSPTGGRFTKVGRTVTFTCAVTLTSKGSASGSATLTGLPWTALGDAIYTPASVGYAAAMAGITGAVLAMVPPGTSRLNLYQSNNGTAAVLSNANLTNTSTLYIAGAYDIA
jgi:hypothetical protein